MICCISISVSCSLLPSIYIEFFPECCSHITFYWFNITYSGCREHTAPDWFTSVWAPKHRDMRNVSWITDIQTKIKSLLKGRYSFYNGTHRHWIAINKLSMIFPTQCVWLFMGVWLYTTHYTLDISNSVHVHHWRFLFDKLLSNRHCTAYRWVSYVILRLHGIT